MVWEIVQVHVGGNSAGFPAEEGDGGFAALFRHLHQQDAPSGLIQSGERKIEDEPQSFFGRQGSHHNEYFSRARALAMG
jgi:hypothetical protein